MEGGAVEHNIERGPPEELHDNEYSGFFCEIFLSTDLYQLYKLDIF
jgi:hypothetical protein